MRRDLHMMEQICYRGMQELVRFQAPQLEAVRPAVSDSVAEDQAIQKEVWQCLFVYHPCGGQSWLWLPQ